MECCQTVKLFPFHRSVVTTSSHFLLLEFGKNFQDYLLNLPRVSKMLLLTHLDGGCDLYILSVLKSLSAVEEMTWVSSLSTHGNILLTLHVY